jgi:hypothetical protein
MGRGRRFQPAASSTTKKCSATSTKKAPKAKRRRQSAEGERAARAKAEQEVSGAPGLFQVIRHRAVAYDEPVGAIFRRRGADVSACPDDAEDVYRRVYRQDLLYV